MISINRLFVFSLAVILTEGSVSMHNPFYCHSEDPIKPQLAMFPVRTAYDTIRGQNINPNVSTCTPSKFWMTSRHGTRLPSPLDLTRILDQSESLVPGILSNYERGRTALCAADFELLQNWEFDPSITLEVASDLTFSGWTEMKELAERYQAAFPSILTPTYSPSDYFFRGTTTQRTQFSLRAFADGIFGANGHEQVQFENVSEPDFVLRPYAQCPLYNEFYAISQLIEQQEFEEMPEYQEMTSQVSAKLGFHGSHALRNIEVQTLALICMYEHVWNVTATSSLCSAFSVANHHVIEYHEDLIYFYRARTPDHPRLFENLNCFLMQDLLRFLQSNDVNDHTVRIFNSHLTQILLIANLFSFETDVLPTRHNFAQQVQRSWKSSQQAPMAANLAVIRYDCDDGDNDILFLLNEKPLQIAGCDSNGICKQSLILERFSRFLDADCSELFCSNS